MHVDYFTMDGGRICQDEMTEEEYNDISVGDIVTVYNKRYVVDKKTGNRFKSIHVREPKILECSSKGDRRFSAMYANVSVHGSVNTIENHYQTSKRFDDPASSTLVPSSTAREAKGRKPTYFVVNGFIYPLEFLSMWYKLLWMKYLDQRPELVEYASHFDVFIDMFKGKNTRNCQADVITQYVKEGRQSIVDDCLPLIWQMRENNKN